MAIDVWSTILTLPDLNFGMPGQKPALSAEIVHTIHHTYHVPSPPQYVHVNVPGPTVVKPVWKPSQALWQLNRLNRQPILKFSGGRQREGAISCEGTAQGRVITECHWHRQLEDFLKLFPITFGQVIDVKKPYPVHVKGPGVEA